MRGYYILFLFTVAVNLMYSRDKNIPFEITNGGISQKKTLNNTFHWFYLFKKFSGYFICYTLIECMDVVPARTVYLST